LQKENEKACLILIGLIPVIPEVYIGDLVLVLKAVHILSFYRDGESVMAEW